MSAPECDFAPSEMSRFDDALHAIDPVLVELAQRYGLIVKRNAPKGWPGRALSCRRWLKTYRIIISMNTSYQDSESDVKWDIHDVWMYDYGEIWRRTVSFRTLASGLSEQAISSPTAFEIVRRTLRDNLRPM